MTRDFTSRSASSSSSTLAGRSFVLLWPLTIILMEALSCATTTPAGIGTAPPTPAVARSLTTSPRHKVTVGSANIKTPNPEGKAWHDSQPSLTNLVVKAAVERFIGSETAKDMKTPTGDVPPSSMVEVFIGAAQPLQSRIAFATLNPRWNWSFCLDERELNRGRDTQIAFVVRDSDGGRVLGKVDTTVGRLLKDGEIQKDDGSVTTLTISVKDLPSQPQPRKCVLRVPASHSDMKQLLADSAKSQDECGNRLPILNGDSILLISSRQVAVTEDKVLTEPREVAIDPDGIPAVDGNYALKPLPECPKERPGALVAITPGGCMFIGKGPKTIRKFAWSGDFILAVNSSDPLGRDSGHFVVEVIVNPLDRLPPPADGSHADESSSSPMPSLDVSEE